MLDQISINSAVGDNPWFAIVGDITDDKGLWHHYAGYAIPATAVTANEKVLQDTLEEYYPHNGSQFFVAFASNREDALDVIQGMFHGRGIHTSPIPEYYSEIMERIGKSTSVPS